MSIENIRLQVYGNVNPVLWAAWKWYIKVKLLNENGTIPSRTPSSIVAQAHSVKNEEVSLNLLGRERTFGESYISLQNKQSEYTPNINKSRANEHSQDEFGPSVRYVTMAREWFEEGNSIR